ncbi:MAG: RNA polymerase sigma factor [Clostridia bacterium]|nr:RNA polymerase sigma factor [Clostridia bacterium]
MDDSKIVDLFLARDESAISHIASKYGSGLRNIASKILNDYTAVEECENDTYLTAWNKIPPNEPRTYLFPFLGKIIRCIATDEVRRQNRLKRNAIILELTAEMEECLPSDASDPDETVNIKELGALITSFLKTCSTEQRKVFVRRYWYFDSIQEISELYGFSKSKVKIILFRMRTDLSAFLQKEGYQV